MTHGRGVDSGTVKEKASVLLICRPGITLHVDEELFDFHITAAPDHSSEHLAEVLEAATTLGLSLLDLDECEPDVLPDDSIRLYLKSIA
ncbi:hypothetical protein [Streptomyces sp. SID10815]|uniref:hypothetical protein n=1 Tax=Streptomyces sp. SID10815 TaxID=2706027 RepID=UPI0013C8F87B|nr:hypothetical protein [Streptomyces sp. SID10815]NEA50466.1 hypothetical protein [Streptomyces sp. SID10815]